MVREKRSFLEKLTGARRISDNEGFSTPVYSDDLVEEDIVMDQPPRVTQERASENWNNDDSEGQLTIDVYQTDTEVVIKSTIAGVKPEDLDVSINNDMITIKGERRNEEIVSEDNYYYQECYWGSFSRSVVLPIDVIADKIEASLKNGILTIRLPKAQTNRAKRIQVRGF